MLGVRRACCYQRVDWWWGILDDAAMDDVEMDDVEMDDDDDAVVVA